MYTLEDLKEANIIVRNEYDSILKELQQELYDTKERLRNLESAILYNSDTERQPKEMPTGFEKLTDKKRAMLEAMKVKSNSDWAISFIDSVLTQGTTSEKQRKVLNDIYQKL